MCIRDRAGSTRFPGGADVGKPGRLGHCHASAELGYDRAALESFRLDSGRLDGGRSIIPAPSDSDSANGLGLTLISWRHQGVAPNELVEQVAKGEQPSGIALNGHLFFT